MGLFATDIVRILQLIEENGAEGKSLCMMGKQDIHMTWKDCARLIEKYHFPCIDSITGQKWENMENGGWIRTTFLSCLDYPKSMR